MEEPLEPSSASTPPGGTGSDPAADIASAAAREQARYNLKTLRAFEILMGERPRRVKPSRYMSTLRRRLRFLEEILRTEAGSEASLRYARSERQALDWAIAKLEPILAAERAAAEAERGHAASAA